MRPRPRLAPSLAGSRGARAGRTWLLPPPGQPRTGGITLPAPCQAVWASPWAAAPSPRRAGAKAAVRQRRARWPRQSASAAATTAAAKRCAAAGGPPFQIRRCAPGPQTQAAPWAAAAARSHSQRHGHRSRHTGPQMRSRPAAAPAPPGWTAVRQSCSGGTGCCSEDGNVTVNTLLSPGVNGVQLSM